MAQNNEVAREFTRFTRVDFIALRYHLSGLSADTIAARLYADETLLERGIHTSAALGKWLDDLKKYLVSLALKQNPYLAQSLEQASKSGRWYKSAMQHLVDLGEKDYSHPLPEDQITQWFKKRVASAFQEDGVHSIADLKTLIEQRGKGWHRPIQRIGFGKAAAIEKWIERNHEHLGTIQWPREIVEEQYELSPTAPRFSLPLEQVSHIDTVLNGSQGINRNHAFCLISARNDLEAIQAWLYKYRNHSPTHRAYRKEVERFLLWCVCVRQVALSSVMIEDCEAYKDFVSAIPASWLAPRVSRRHSSWRPFASQLSPESQKYAIQTLRHCFEWLVRVRYLGGNPWVAVTDPAIEQRETSLQIHKALPQDIWNSLVKPCGWLDQACTASKENCVNLTPKLESYPYSPKSKQAVAAQYRLARAAIFLIGFTGIRREEAARATTRHLKPVQLPTKSHAGCAPSVWELSVLGKRNKWRTVYLPLRALHALEAHLNDRRLSLFQSKEECVKLTHFDEAHLLAPVVLPRTQSALHKHANNLTGFEPDALYKMTKTVLLRMTKDPSLRLSDAEKTLLHNLAPHALRHTFATSAAAHDMPIDVLQSLLGHKSVQTTSLYVQAEKTRSIAEVQKMFAKLPAE